MLGLGDEVRGHATGVGRRRRRGPCPRTGRPAGRCRPRRETSIFAAVTQALPGPTIRSTGARPRVREPVGQRADRLGAAGDDERVDLEQARPRRAGPGGSRRRGPAGRRDDDPLDAGDAGRHDGHDQRRRVRRRAARDVGADRVERRPAALDLDARDDRRPGRRRALGLGESADVVDRLVEGAPDRAGRGASRAATRSRGRGRAGRRRRPPPTRVVGLADGRRRRAPGRRRGSPRDAVADRRVRDGAAADERVAVGDARAGSPAATSRRGRAGARRERAAVAVTGRSSRSGGRGCPMRRPP